MLRAQTPDALHKGTQVAHVLFLWYMLATAAMHAPHEQFNPAFLGEQATLAGWLESAGCYFQDTMDHGALHDEAGMHARESSSEAAGQHRHDMNRAGAAE